MPDQQFTWPQGEEIVYLRPPKEEYHGALPSFYENDWFPELAPLKENWEGIRDEILNYEKSRGDITGMSSYSPAQTSGVNAWSTINLMSYGVLYHKGRKDFPLLTRITDSISNITTVTISVLNPHTEIKPHYGDTNGVIRAHLGLVVPDPYPTIAMRVGKEERGWVDGELLLFTIVQQHSVWSKSDRRRYLLIVDFVPKVLGDRQNEICAKTLGSQTYIFLYKRVALFRHLPEFMVQFLCFSFSVFWRVFLPIQQRVKFITPG